MAKNPAAVALGKLGAKATNKKLTAEQRQKNARRAANARWSKSKSVSSSRPLAQQATHA